MQMLVEKPNPDEWWWGVSSEFRSFCRDVISLANDLVAGEVLELRFDGRKFSPVLRHGHKPVGERFKLSQQSPEEWWTGLSPSQRGFIQELAELVGSIQRGPGKKVEVTNTDGTLTAALVLGFKRPVGGRAATN